MILGDASAIASSEHLQPYSNASLVTHNVVTVPACSPSHVSSISDEYTREPMNFDGDDLRREDPTASVPTIREGNTIMIEDSDRNGDSHVAP